MTPQLTEDDRLDEILRTPTAKMLVKRDVLMTKQVWLTDESLNNAKAALQQLLVEARLKEFDKVQEKYMKLDDAAFQTWMYRYETTELASLNKQGEA